MINAFELRDLTMLQEECGNSLAIHWAQGLGDPVDDASSLYFVTLSMQNIGFEHICSSKQVIILEVVRVMLGYGRPTEVTTIELSFETPGFGRSRSHKEMRPAFQFLKKPRTTKKSISLPPHSWKLECLIISMLSMTGVIPSPTPTRH